MYEVFNKRHNRDFRVDLRRRATFAERLLWKFIQNDQLGHRFRRQFGIDNYIADFYCPTKQLVIELDGPIHDSKQAQDYDRRRNEHMLSLGLTVLRFKNDELNTDLEGVLKRIADWLESH